MKCRLMVIMAVLLSATQVRAQVSFNWSEFFKQKKTEIKYLGAQIGELAIYLDFVKKGYRIVTQGNELIRQAKNGEFNLHDVFYLSLKLVNQQVRNYPALRATIDYHHYIATASKELQQAVDKHEAFTAKERLYVSSTLQRLKEDMATSLDQLMMVTTDRELELSTDERQRRIDLLRDYAHKRVLFIKDYHIHVMGMAALRTREKAEAAVLKSLHGIK